MSPGHRGFVGFALPVLNQADQADPQLPLDRRRRGGQYQPLCGHRWSPDCRPGRSRLSADPVSALSRPAVRRRTRVGTVCVLWAYTGRDLVLDLPDLPRTLRAGCDLSVLRVVGGGDGWIVRAVARPPEAVGLALRGGPAHAPHPLPLRRLRLPGGRLLRRRRR